MSPTAVAARAGRAAVPRPAPRPPSPRRPGPRPAGRPALRLVDPATRRARRRRRHLGWAAALTVAALLTVVVFHVLLAQRQLTIDTLQRQTAAAEHRYEEVRLEHARLASPARIVARAAQLGLVAPSGPPIAVPVTGAAPTPPGRASTTLDGWTEVKPTLGASP